MLHFSYGAASHVGLVRDHNEDAGFAGPYLQLVADGVGGAAAGEVASATTAYVVTALAMGRPDQEAATLLAEAVVTAHRELQRGTRDDEARHGMATTLTAVLVRGDRVTLAHVGDSRAYLVRDGELDRLSTDQTLVQLLVEKGDLRPDQVSTHPFRNVVLRSVNGDEPVEPALRELDLVVGDRLLLCSDGLTDLVAEDEILQALIVEDPDEAARALVGLALTAGGRDNVTCLVADLRDGSEVKTDGRLLGAMQDPRLVVDPSRRPSVFTSGPSWRSATRQVTLSRPPAVNASPTRARAASSGSSTISAWRISSSATRSVSPSLPTLEVADHQVELAQGGLEPGSSPLTDRRTTFGTDRWRSRPAGGLPSRPAAVPASGRSTAGRARRRHRRHSQGVARAWARVTRSPRTSTAVRVVAMPSRASSSPCAALPLAVRAVTTASARSVAAS